MQLNKNPWLTNSSYQYKNSVARPRQDGTVQDTTGLTHIYSQTIKKRLFNVYITTILQNKNVIEFFKIHYTLNQ